MQASGKRSETTRNAYANRVRHNSRGIYGNRRQKTKKFPRACKNPSCGNSSLSYCGTTVVGLLSGRSPSSSDNVPTRFQAMSHHALDSFYRAMLCIRGTSHEHVSVRLCLCPCLSQAGVLLKRQNVASQKQQHHTIPQGH